MMSQLSGISFVSPELFELAIYATSLSILHSL